MGKTALPSVYPAEGTYEFSPIHIRLESITNNAKIYYTTDGSLPTTESKCFHDDEGLICFFVRPSNEKEIILRAFAIADGYDASDIAEYHFKFVCRKKGTYRHSILRRRTPDHSGLIRIEDYELEKMYLIIGQERAVLIDAGWDESGDLPSLCNQLTGGLPLDLVIAHAHPDHVMQAEKFIQKGYHVYLPPQDHDLALKFLPSLDLSKTLPLTSETCLDLGNTYLNVYSIPGHTPGGSVLVDEKTGDVFSSDEFGSCRRYVCDSAFLQLTDISLESVLRSLEQFLDKTEGKIKRIFTGHNDEPLDAIPYLEKMRDTLLRAVANGDNALVPSLRSAEETMGSGTAIYEGDYRYDPNWFSANVKFITDEDVVHHRFCRGFDPKLSSF